MENRVKFSLVDLPLSFFRELCASRNEFMSLREAQVDVKLAEGKQSKRQKLSKRQRGDWASVPKGGAVRQMPHLKCVTTSDNLLQMFGEMHRIFFEIFPMQCNWLDLPQRA
jgi:hypothetical protein